MDVGSNEEHRYESVLQSMTCSVKLIYSVWKAKKLAQRYIFSFDWEKPLSVLLRSLNFVL